MKFFREQEEKKYKCHRKKFRKLSTQIISEWEKFIIDDRIQGKNEVLFFREQVKKIL